MSQVFVGFRLNSDQNYSMWHKKLLPTDSNPSQYKSSKFITTWTWITICRSVGSSLFVPWKPSFSTHMTNFMETFPNYNSKRDHSSVILFGLDWSHNHPPSNPFICIHLSWPNAGSFWKDHSYNLAKSWPIVHSYISFRPYLNIFTVYDKWLSYHTPVRLKIKGAWSKICFPFNLPFLDCSWLFLGGWPGHTQMSKSFLLLQSLLLRDVSHSPKVYTGCAR